MSFDSGSSSSAARNRIRRRDGRQSCATRTDVSRRTRRSEAGWRPCVQRYLFLRADADAVPPRTLPLHQLLVDVSHDRISHQRPQRRRRPSLGLTGRRSTTSAASKLSTATSRCASPAHPIHDACWLPRSDPARRSHPPHHHRLHLDRVSRAASSQRIPPPSARK